MENEVIDARSIKYVCNLSIVKKERKAIQYCKNVAVKGFLSWTWNGSLESMEVLRCDSYEAIFIDTKWFSHVFSFMHNYL